MSNVYDKKRLELNGQIAELESRICDLQMQIEAAKKEIIRLNYVEKELYFSNLGEDSNNQ